MQNLAPAHRIRLPVLGVVTTFTADSADAVAAIRRAYGDWEALFDVPGLATPSDALVRLQVRPGSAIPTPDGPLHRLEGRTRMVAASADAHGVADTLRGEAHAVVTERLVRDPPRLLAEVLEPLTLFLLGARDREPLHAAAIVRDGTAILLAAPSGTGKSSVAYAASHAGFSILADEPVYVQRRPRLRVWGRHGRLHLPPAAARRFTELQALAPVRLPTGKTKLVVEPSRPGPRWADRVGLCLLHRPGGDPDADADAPAAVRLAPVTPDEAVRQLTTRLDPGYDLFAASIPGAVAAAAAAGAWRLTLGDDPRDAVPLLDRIAAELARGAPARD